MRSLIYTSLAINVLVLVPVCLGLLSKAGWTIPAYGPDSAARAILLSVYLAILFCSAGLMAKPIPMMVAALLMVQIIYKLITPFAVGNLSNPVIVSNLAIAAFHSVTLWSIWKGTAP